MDQDFVSKQTSIRWNGDVGMVEFDGGSKGQMAIFYNKSVHNAKKSREQGCPVFEDQVYVRVAPPGERLNIVDRPANRQDAQRWPIQWAAFQQNREQTPEGTPIDLLYPEKPAVAATLRANGVLTIDMCATLSANAIENIGMGAQAWVNAAQKYMESANKGVAITQFRKEMEEKEGQIRVLTRQVEQLLAEVNVLRSEKGSSVQLADIQKMVAVAMGRPEIPMSGSNPIAKQFDAQQSQINGVSADRNKRKRVKL